jgi:spore coat polysaccharide biosynthesis predicted glycosyltransferase SpsG
MRSAAIAEKAISRGIECSFVGTIQNIEWVSQWIGTLGFFEIVEPDKFVPDASTDILILDSYTLEINEYFIQPTRWRNIVVLSDESTPNYVADLVVHPGLDGSWNRANYKNFLYGPKFIPLRKSITVQSHRQQEIIDKILIFGGGTDPYKFAVSIAQILKYVGGFSSASFFSQNRSEIQQLDSRFRVLNFGSSLDKEIDSAELIFTTASTSSLEVVARGIPLGVACAVPNQSNYQVALGHHGVAGLIGTRVTTGAWQLDRNEIEKLIMNFAYRQDLVKNSKGLIDLGGATRIIDAIIKLNN